MSLLSFLGGLFRGQPGLSADMSPEEAAAWARQRIDAINASEAADYHIKRKPVTISDVFQENSREVVFDLPRDSRKKF